MSKDCIQLLLVEDSPSDAQLLCESLQDYSLQGFEIVRAERLDEAVGLLRQKSFDVILLDLNLPDSAGMETCKRISPAAGQTPIIVLTGADDEAIAIEAMHLGIQDYLVKGQMPAGVIARAIRYAVERDQTRRSLRELNATLESKVAQRTAELQHRARQLQKMTLEVSLTEDRERRRLAEILHDDLQQIIAGAKFHLCLLKKRVKYDDSLQGIASRIDDILTEAMEKSRGLSHELSPNILHHADFTETLDWLANQVRAKHGLVVRVQADGPAKVQSDAIRTFLYKTAQELLFNVVKHARTKKAGIRVRRFGSYLCLSVSDRGRGFDPQGLREAAGFGLLSIRERIELLGGRMKIRSAKGKGSTLFVVVPDSREPQDHVESRSSLPTSRSAHRTRLRVLLADDHKIVRE